MSKAVVDTYIYQDMVEWALIGKKVTRCLLEEHFKNFQWPDCNQVYDYVREVVVEDNEPIE